MLVLKSAEVFKDKIKIGDKEMEYSFKPEEIGATYYSLLRELTKEESKKDQDATRYAQLFINLVGVIFGEVVTKELLAYYKQDYEKMVDDTYLYIGTVIAPVMKKASKERKKRLKEQKKAMRRASMRRWFA